MRFSLYHIRKEDLICGIPDEKKAYDKLCVAQICLRENSDDARNEMIRLLNTVFSQSMTKEEILEQLEKEYRIPLDTGVRKEIDFMCNLSEMIEEKGRAEGRIQGRTEGRMEGEKDLGTLVRLLVRDRKMDLLEEVTLNKEMRGKAVQRIPYYRIRIYRKIFCERFTLEMPGNPVKFRKISWFLRGLFYYELYPVELTKRAKKEYKEPFKGSDEPTGEASVFYVLDGNGDLEIRRQTARV